jgi:hypothetical protein
MDSEHISLNDSKIYHSSLWYYDRILWAVCVQFYNKDSLLFLRRTFRKSILFYPPPVRDSIVRNWQSNVQWRLFNLVNMLSFLTKLLVILKGKVVYRFTEKWERLYNGNFSNLAHEQNVLQYTQSSTGSDSELNGIQLADFLTGKISRTFCNAGFADFTVYSLADFRLNILAFPQI